MKRCLSLIVAYLFFLALVPPVHAAEEVRQLGTASATGGYSGDIRLGNNCTTSPLGKFYCGLNARHIYFYADNTVDVDHLYTLASADTGFPYVLGGTWSIDSQLTHIARLCTGTQDNTTFLRMDGQCAVPPGGGTGNGDMLMSTYDADEDDVVDSAIATAITDGLIVDADVNAAADIDGSKLLDNSVTTAKVQCSGTKDSTTYLRMDGTCATVSATPGGTDNQIQYNNDGSFGGVANSAYDSVEETLTLPAVKAPSVTATQTASPGCAKLWEGSGGGTDATGFCAPATVTDNTFYTLPDGDGNSGDMLTTNGSKVLGWTAPGTATAIPQGTDPVVDSAGEIAIDTTATPDQLRYYGGGEVVIDARRTENATFKTPVSGDKAKFRKPFGMTVTSVGCVTDAATSAVLDVQECNANGATCTTILSGTITCGTTYEYTDGTPSVSDTAIAAGNYVFFSVGTVTGTVGYLYVDFNYTVTKE